MEATVAEWEGAGHEGYRDWRSLELVRSTPTGLGENQPGVATRRYLFACIDTGYDTQVDTVVVDIVLGPPRSRKASAQFGGSKLAGASCQVGWRPSRAC